MDISKWFYRPHYTTPELDKKIEDRERFFRKELLEVKAKLNAAGVQTNEVYTNKKDLYRAMNERTGGSK